MTYLRTLLLVFAVAVVAGQADAQGKSKKAKHKPAQATQKQEEKVTDIVFGEVEKAIIEEFFGKNVSTDSDKKAKKGKSKQLPPASGKARYPAPGPGQARYPAAGSGQTRYPTRPRCQAGSAGQGHGNRNHR